MHHAHLRRREIAGAEARAGMWVGRIQAHTFLTLSHLRGGGRIIGREMWGGRPESGSAAEEGKRKEVGEREHGTRKVSARDGS
eukprot:691052-Pleurochrysis_carterae.AAC.4